MCASLNVALAGICGYGHQYLDTLLHDPRAAGTRLVGIVEPVPHKSPFMGELEARRIPVYRDLQSLFSRDKIDLMLIVTPIHMHSSQTCFALKQGAHVLCEKPLAGTLEDAHKMIEASRTSKRFAAIGFQWSFSSAVHSLKRDILSGSLGRPLRMKSLAYFPRAVSYFHRNDWAGRIRTADGAGVSDSPVNNATAHYLHNMLYLLGPSRQTSIMPTTVQAELYRANDIENHDTAALRATTSIGAEILFYTTHATQLARGPMCEFKFERATVFYDGNTSAQFIAHFHDGRVKSYGQPNLDRHEKIWQTTHCVRSGEPVACDVHAALPHTVCTMVAQESSEIHTFPRSMQQVIETETGPMITINGLDAALVDCYSRSILPSEAAYEWASPGRIVNSGGVRVSVPVRKAVESVH